MIINGNRSNDRKRLDIAHELGHILMHLFPNIAIPSYRDKEKEAFRFAAEFLMPEKEIKNSLLKPSSRARMIVLYLTKRI